MVSIIAQKEEFILSFHLAALVNLFEISRYESVFLVVSKEVYDKRMCLNQEMQMLLLVLDY